MYTNQPTNPDSKRPESTERTSCARPWVASFRKQRRQLMASAVFGAALLLGACASQAPTPPANNQAVATLQPTVVAEAATSEPTATSEAAATSEPTATANAAPQGQPPQGTPPSGAPPSGDPPQGTPPGPPPDGSSPGAPPSGSAPGGAPGGGMNGSSIETGLASATGVYTVDGEQATQTDQTYSADAADQSAVYVINGGQLTLNNPTVNKTGDTSSNDNSSFYGLNAGILATGASQVTINGGTINTNASGANGAFAAGEGTKLTIANTVIKAVGDGAHAVMATLGGVIELTNVQMTTTDAHSGAVATDRGSGTIIMKGGSVVTSGTDSPAVYSTGAITVSDATLTATGAEAAVIEGTNQITLINSTLTSSFADKWGVMLYQSFSGDAEGQNGTFTMEGGSLSYTSKTGPLFYVTNTIGNIVLKGVDLSAGSNIFLKVAGNERWGTVGSNGGTANIVAEAQKIAGDIVADAISAVTLELKQGSTFSGAVDTANTAKSVTITLDTSSSWSVTADSYVTCLNGAVISGTSVSNITGNGHTVFYDSANCAALNGKTYTLQGGGSLQPGS